MSVSPIVRRMTTAVVTLVALLVTAIAFAIPSSAAAIPSEPERCGKTGYVRVFTLNPTKGHDFVVKMYRKPAKDDPKGTAPRCIILWAKAKGKAKLTVNGWSKTKSLKKGKSIQHLVGPNGYLTVRGTFKRSGHAQTHAGPVTYWF